MNTRPASCCSIGKQMLPSCSTCLFKGCEHLGPHFCLEAPFCTYMPLERAHCHQWSMSQDYPKQCALTQYLSLVSSLPWGTDLCNGFLIWGYFSFFLTGSSFDLPLALCFLDILHVTSSLLIHMLWLQSPCDLICFPPVAHDWIFWGCNICLNRSFKVVYKEPERCLKASSRSERLTQWSLWTFGTNLGCYENLLQLITLTMRCCDDSHFVLGRSLVVAQVPLCPLQSCVLPFLSQIWFLFVQKVWDPSPSVTIQSFLEV